MTTSPGMRATGPGGRYVRALMGNVLQGARLACGLRRPRFSVSLGQLAGLLALGWLIAFAVDWHAQEGGRLRMSDWGLAAAAARAYWWLVAVAFIAFANGTPRLALRIAVACAAAEPLLWGGWLGAQAFTARLPLPADWPSADFLWWATLVWQAGVMGRALRLTDTRMRWRVPLLAGLYGLSLYVVGERTPDAALLTPVARRAPAPLDVEATYYAQSALLDAALARLDDGRPGLPDVWFVGFGAYADEAVFRREATQVQDIVGTHFDAASRSLLLLNSRRTLTRLPLANGSNLDFLLRHLGQRMERDEDILFLFLTSHGREDGDLVVEFADLGLRDLSPLALRRMLDEAGIRFRVIVVSACFSGAFVPELAGPDTLVITAAAHDRSSFGCAHENQWTYFGEAFFRDALAGGQGLAAAFETARAAIERRERHEGKTPSRPQFVMGDAIARQLARFVASRP